MLNVARYPKQGVIGPQRGLNLFDRLFDVNRDEALVLRNYLFKGSSIVQRSPFQDLNSNVTTFTTPFRGAHSYAFSGASEGSLLYAENDGKVKQFANPPVLKYTFPTAAKDVCFATALDSVVAVNGTDPAAIGTSSGWVQMGSPAAITNLAVAQNAGAGIAAGTYLHIVIPVIEISGIAQIFANWSNVIKNVVAAPIASFGGTFTYPTDPRVSSCLVFRTLVNSSIFYFVSRVTTGAFTDSNADSALPVASTVAPSNPPSQNKSWGVPPVGSLVAYCGNRLVIGALSTKKNALATSQIGATNSEIQGFPADGSTIVPLPKDGDMIALFPIGETGEGALRANHLFVAQKDACYIMQETNPALPLQIISSDIGVISKKAIAQWKNWLFFQGRQGVYMWPGSGKQLYLLSEKVSPIFAGGGNQNLSGNSGDENIQYAVYDNALWVTVKNDSALSYANKIWVLDLLQLERSFDPQNPSKSARWTGPIDALDGGIQMAYSHLLRDLNNKFIVLDSTEERVYEYKASSRDTDVLGGVSQKMPLRVLSGPLMSEDPLSQKQIFRIESLRYSFSSTDMRLAFEGDQKVTTLTMVPQGGSILNWDDIAWDDILWTESDWIQSGVTSYGQAIGRWFCVDELKEVLAVSEAFTGWVFYYHAFRQLGVFK